MKDEKHTTIQDSAQQAEQLEKEVRTQKDSGTYTQDRKSVV